MKLLVFLFLFPIASAFSPFYDGARQRSSTKLNVSRRSVLDFGVRAASAMALVTIPSRQALAIEVGGKITFGDESIMSPKAHGTSELPVQSDLLYGVSNSLADRICNYNRHFAETGGYFQTTNWEETIMKANGQPVTFYDSVNGKPLFVAPIGRSASELIAESKKHGWPSFRDEEVVWENVRVLRNSGEVVSVSGTHLGHNIKDNRNRYCINLVSIAGKPSSPTV